MPCNCAASAAAYCCNTKCYQSAHFQKNWVKQKEAVMTTSQKAVLALPLALGCHAAPAAFVNAAGGAAGDCSSKPVAGQRHLGTHSSAACWPPNSSCTKGPAKRLVRAAPQPQPAISAWRGKALPASLPPCALGTPPADLQELGLRRSCPARNAQHPTKKQMIILPIPATSTRRRTWTIFWPANFLVSASFLGTTSSADSGRRRHLETIPQSNETWLMAGSMQASLLGTTSSADSKADEELKHYT